MGLFDKKTKQPEKEQTYIDLHPNDRATFEEICAKENISIRFEQQPNGAIRYYFDAAFAPVIEQYISQEEAPAAPAPEGKKQSLNDMIAGTREDPKPEPSYLEKMGLAEDPAPTDLPPTELENRWAEETIAAELREHSPAAQEEETPRRKRRSLGRVNQIKTRLTDAELAQFQRRVKKSGLSQGDFLRSAALTGKIVIQENNPTDIALIDELTLIRAELGRQGGMLKMIIKPNEGQRELTPEEWAELIGAIRYMEHTKDRLAQLEVKLTNGNHNAPNK